MLFYIVVFFLIFLSFITLVNTCTQDNSTSQYAYSETGNSLMENIVASIFDN